MNGYNVGSYKSTSMGAVVWLRCGTLATVLAVAPFHDVTDGADQTTIGMNELGYAPYSTTSSLGTAVTTQVQPYVKVSSDTHEFEGAVSRFYADLAGSQETLGPQFSEVLADNLWDLYVRV